MENLKSEKEMLRSIDRDAYILKLKIASVLNGKFGADIDMGTVENMHFTDMLNAVSGKYDADELYQALKKTAGHGLTEKQKEFLYDHALCPFTSFEWDFDDYLEQMRSSLLNNMAVNGSRIVVVPQYDQNTVGPDLLCFYGRPLVTMEMFTLIPEEYPPSEAILLQNGYVLIVRTLYSLDEIDFVRALTQRLEQESWDDDDV